MLDILAWLFGAMVVNLPTSMVVTSPTSPVSTSMLCWSLRRPRLHFVRGYAR